MAYPKRRKNEPRGTYKTARYYERIKARRGIEDSKKRTELIKWLMMADKERAKIAKMRENYDPNSESTTTGCFEQWDCLETKYLKWAWDIWARKLV